MFKNYVNNISETSKKQLIIIPVIIGLCIFAMPGIFQLFFNLIFPAPLDKVGSLSGALGMITTIIISIFAIHKISKVDYEDIGLNKNTALKNIFLGGFFGLLLICLVTLAVFLLGAVSFKVNHNLGISGLLIGLVFFIFQGTWEELIYRAYLMPRFTKAFNDKIAIVVTSILFTLGHSLNPNMQLLPVINLFLASIVFSLVYYYTGSLLFVGLSHGIWNFSQGFVFGAEVSGNKITDSILMASNIPGKELISGGFFGFEGGIITSIFAVILIIYLSYLIKSKNKEV